MAAWADTAPRAEPAPRPRARPRPRPASRPRRSDRPAILGGALWIGVLAALLAGVVALNVAALQLNMRLDSLAQERANLRAANAALSSRLSSAAATPRIEALAQKQLGLVQATQEQTTYVRLPAGK
ncbi:MAG: hypothetical protein ACRDN6_03770 [Gaiellaceae bacterium]